MLSKKVKKVWLISTIVLSIIWAAILAIYYILHFGWMDWPLVVERSKVPLVGQIHLVWWLAFLLQALYPAANSVVFQWAASLYYKDRDPNYEFFDLVVPGMMFMGLFVVVLGTSLAGSIIGCIVGGELLGGLSVFTGGIFGMIIVAIIVQKTFF
jgi:hypothetical protein